MISRSDCVGASAAALAGNAVLCLLQSETGHLETETTHFRYIFQTRCETLLMIWSSPLLPEHGSRWSVSERPLSIVRKNQGIEEEGETWLAVVCLRKTAVHCKKEPGNRGGGWKYWLEHLMDWVIVVTVAASLVCGSQLELTVDDQWPQAGCLLTYWAISADTTNADWVSDRTSYWLVSLHCFDRVLHDQNSVTADNCRIDD